MRSSSYLRQSAARRTGISAALLVWLGALGCVALSFGWGQPCGAGRAIAQEQLSFAQANAAESETQLRSYALPAGRLSAVVAQLREEFRHPQLRIAADERTEQILVSAPPALHTAIARRVVELSSTAPANAPAPTNTAAPFNAPAPPSAAPTAATPGTTTRAATMPMATAPASVATPAASAPRSTTQSLQLQHTTWPRIEQALRTASRGRLSAQTTIGGLVTCVLSFADGTSVQFAAMDQDVTIRGTPERVASCLTLLGLLDRSSLVTNARTQVVSTENLPAQQLRRTAAAIQFAGNMRTTARAPAMAVAGPGAAGPAVAVPNPPVVAPRAAPQAGANVGQGATARVPLLARVFQLGVDTPPAGADTEDETDPAAGVVQDPSGAVLPPEGQAPAASTVITPEEPLGTGLVGPVQIEFLEGLDVMVISGHERDVERVIRIIDDIERLSQETEPVIEVYELKHVSGEALATIIAQLYTQVLSPRQGTVSITPLVKPNALLLIGRDESVKAVIDLIERLDQPVEPTGQFAVFPLRNASVTAVQATVQSFFEGRSGLGTRVLVAIDHRSNSLIVQASPRDLAEVAELIQRLDTTQSESVNDLRIFSLRNSLAEDLAPVLQNAILGTLGAGQQIPGLGGAGQQPQQPGAAGQLAAARSAMLRFMAIDSQGGREVKSGILSDIRITADPRANALVVSAPADSMDLIAALVKQLDEIPAAEAQIKVFTIVNGDAGALVQMLEALFGQRTGNATAGMLGLVGATGGVQGDSALISLRFSVDQRTNSIIATGSSNDLNVVEAILLRLDESDVRQRQSVVYRLKNAPALDVSNSINEFLRSEREVQQVTPGAVSPFEQIEREVVVVPEPVSNSLIVSATPRYFEEIRRIVEELDARPPMVMIQVLIAEVALNNTDEFGVELGLQDSVLFDRSLLGDLVTTTNSTQTPEGNTVVTTTNQIIRGASNTPGFAFNNQPLGNSGSDIARQNAGRVASQGLSHFSVGRINSDLGFGGLVLSASSESVSVLIRALQECRRLDVLSRPQVMTLDNQPAFIQVGSRVPRVSGVQINETGQVNNVTDVNVGLILGVTPRISPDGLVVMEIDAEKSALGPETEGVPISISATGEVVRQPLINTTTAQTTVSAASGQTVVLGGLITKAKTTVHRRVPGLANIPLVGNLFRYDLEAVQRTELLIIMTPYIVRSEQDASLIKQREAARMSWCLADVERMHGDIGVRRHESSAMVDDRTIVIYPDLNPSGDPNHQYENVEVLPPGTTLPLEFPGSESSPQRAPLRAPLLPAQPGNAQPQGNLPLTPAPLLPMSHSTSSRTRETGTAETAMHNDTMHEGDFASGAEPILRAAPPRGQLDHYEQREQLGHREQGEAYHQRGEVPRANIEASSQVR